MNTLLCVTVEPGVPGVRPCTIRDAHTDRCDDDYCTGCLPREARVGCLCMTCWLRLETAWSEWAILEPFLSYAVLSPREPGLSRSPAGPRIPLPQTALSADEVRSWLRDEPQDARAWVSTIRGAVNAVGFSFAVQRAVRAHQWEEKPRQLQRMRCTDCGQLVVWMPPAGAFEPVTVKCEGCGRTITETDQWTTYRRTTEAWEGRKQSAMDVIAEIETRRKSVMTVMDEEETA